MIIGGVSAFVDSERQVLPLGSLSSILHSANRSTEIFKLIDYKANKHTHSPSLQSYMTSAPFSKKQALQLLGVAFEK